MTYRNMLLFLLLFSTTAMADEAFVGYGLGILRGADTFLGQTKYLDLGYREFMWDGIYWQNKVTAWGEGSPDLTRKGGGYFSTGLGLEVELQPLELRGGGSLGAISAPDSQLGAVFPQFNENFGIGLRDKKGDGIAFEYDHISCSSFCHPNMGRDFIMLELSQKW